MGHRRQILTSKVDPCAIRVKPYPHYAVLRVWTYMRGMLGSRQLSVWSGLRAGITPDMIRWDPCLYRQAQLPARQIPAAEELTRHWGRLRTPLDPPDSPGRLRLHVDHTLGSYQWWMFSFEMEVWGPEASPGEKASHPAGTQLTPRLPNAVSMLAQRRRRWSCIKTTLDQCLVGAENPVIILTLVQCWANV